METKVMELTCKFFDNLKIPNNDICGEDFCNKVKEMSLIKPRNERDKHHSGIVLHYLLE